MIDPATISKGYRVSITQDIKREYLEERRWEVSHCGTVDSSENLGWIILGAFVSIIKVTEVLVSLDVQG